MKRIIDFVSGKMTYEEFEAEFSLDPTIWDLAQSLLTPDIMNDAAHPFWTKSNRMRLESNNYCVQYACLSFGYDVLGRSVTHGMLGDLVSFQYPDVVLREPPQFSAVEMRDKLGMDYLGGTEVDALIDEFLQKKPEDISVTKFINQAKQEIRQLFHIVPKKYPRWVQEPEWPMGKNSPMQYISQKQNGELVEFTFQDVDTGEMRVVQQYY